MYKNDCTCICIFILCFLLTYNLNSSALQTDKQKDIWIQIYRVREAKMYKNDCTCMHLHTLFLLPSQSKQRCITDRHTEIYMDTDIQSEGSKDV